MLRSFILGLAVFCLVWGARLAVVDRFGSDLPRNDQWDAEYGMVLALHLQGQLAFSDLFIAHNEHVIACTKATALFLFSVNGQWDNRVECVVNAAMAAAFAVLLVIFGRRMLGVATGFAWLFVVVLLWAPPVALTNVLSGFHSQQLFLIAFSVVGIALLVVCREWSAGWIAGVCCGVLALLSMASGLLMAVAVAVALVMGKAVDARLRERIWTILACLVLAVVGFALRGEADWHATLRAQSIADFFGAFWKALMWPVDFLPIWPLLGWSPWVWLAWRVSRSEKAGHPGERVVFAVGLWVLLQIVATAYARGAGAPAPSSRYLDTLSVGVGVNILALLLAIERNNPLGRALTVRRWLVASGALLLAIGFSVHLGRVVSGSLPEYGARAREWELNVRAYVVDGDRDALIHGEIPYISSERLIEYLDQPEVRAILPASVREDGRQGPLSLIAERVTRRSVAFVIAGLVLFLSFLALNNSLRGESAGGESG